MFSKLDHMPAHWWLREVHRFPWQKTLALTNKEVISFHGFEQERSRFYAESIQTSMKRLWTLGLRSQKRAAFGSKAFLVRESEVGNELLCSSEGVVDAAALEQGRVECLPKSAKT